jgi:hypothetical protein
LVISNYAEHFLTPYDREMKLYDRQIDSRTLRYEHILA